MLTQRATVLSRMQLRPLLEQDIAALFEIQGDANAMRFTYCAPSLEDCANRLKAFESLRAVNGFAPWVVTEGDQSKIVGWGGLGVDPFDPEWGPEVIYWFSPSCWGQGLATELVAHSLSVAFGALALSSVSAFALPSNVASIRVLGKTGFELLGFVPRLERNHYEVRPSVQHER